VTVAVTYAVLYRQVTKRTQNASLEKQRQRTLRTDRVISVISRSIYLSLIRCSAAIFTNSVMVG